MASLPIPWRQGEHVAVVGQTGSGKTFLEARLLPLRDNVIVLRTKADDIKFEGYTHTTTAATMDRLDVKRILLAPKRGHQAVECFDAIERAWKQGGWCVALDELFYVHQKLRLGDEVDMLLTQGRSKKLSVVVGMQRPSRISRFALSEVTHAFLFHLEGRDVKQVVGQSLSPRVAEIIELLRPHEFVYYHVPTRTIARGYAQGLSDIIRKG